jgi:hypothetical protein
MNESVATSEEGTVQEMLELFWKEMVEYAVWTDKVAVYPDTAESYYLTLGMVDELGEVMDASAIDDAEEARARFGSELGDVLWYLLRYIYRRGWFTEIRTLLGNFEEQFSKSYNHFVFGSFLRHAATLAGFEKKCIRDGDTWTPEKRRVKTHEAQMACAGMVYSAMRACEDQGLSLLQLLDDNRDKLDARLKEGTIKGDGEKR